MGYLVQPNQDLLFCTIGYSRVQEKQSDTFSSFIQTMIMICDCDIFLCCLVLSCDLLGQHETERKPEIMCITPTIPTLYCIGDQY